jgi:hypothetical protein
MKTVYRAAGAVKQKAVFAARSTPVKGTIRGRQSTRVFDGMTG